MKRLLLLGVFVCLMLTRFQAAAQTLSVTQDTLQWHVSALFDQAADSTGSFSCSFITYGQGRILWLQKEGTYSTEFSVSSAEGSWSNIQQPGSVTYHVSCFGKHGDLIFMRSQSGTSIRMVFLENNVNTMPLEFQVTSITPVP